MKFTLSGGLILPGVDVFDTNAVSVWGAALLAVPTLALVAAVADALFFSFAHGEAALRFLGL